MYHTVMFAVRYAAVVMLAATFSGCFIIEPIVFPVWDENYFDAPPAELGPYDVIERRVDVPDGADGRPSGITIFEPADAPGPLPAFVWVMGSNVQAYYHQSLHETLASWGYAVIVPDTRPLWFADLRYHRRIVQLALQAVDMAVAGDLGLTIDPERIAAGGYSIGGPLAAFTAAQDGRISHLVFWAPDGSPVWSGVRPARLYPDVWQPALYVLGELDPSAGPEGYPKEMQAQMPDSEATVAVIPGGVHLFFQQPVGADGRNPETDLTRFEQQGIAIETTRRYLNERFGITRSATTPDCDCLLCPFCRN